jgi:hypothetical protein
MLSYASVSTVYHVLFVPNVYIMPHIVVFQAFTPNTRNKVIITKRIYI